MDPMHIIYLLAVAFFIPISMLIQAGLARLVSHARRRPAPRGAIAKLAVNTPGAQRVFQTGDSQ